MNVELNPNTIKSSLSNAEASLDLYNTMVNKISTAVNGTTIWAGYDHDSFVNVMNDFVNELKSLQKSIESHNELISSYISAGESLDSEYAGKNISIT